jgi:hypothetical protein
MQLLAGPHLEEYLGSNQQVNRLRCVELRVGELYMRRDIQLARSEPQQGVRNVAGNLGYDQKIELSGVW